MADIFDDESIKKEKIKISDLPEIFERLKHRIQDYFDEANKKIEERPADLFFKSLYMVFSEYKQPKEYVILEYAAPIISNEEDTLRKAYSVQQIVYIDTPMLWGARKTEKNNYDYWMDTNQILKRQAKNYNENVYNTSLSFKLL